MHREERLCIQGADYTFMGIFITHKGSFKNTERMFQHMSRFEISRVLNKYGERGVAALSAATPVNSG